MNEPNDEPVRATMGGETNDERSEREENTSSLSRAEEMAQLRRRLELLETEVENIGDSSQWEPPSYYTVYHLMAGMVLGLLGSATSLLFNIVGATLVGKHPLELVRVYLTFPLGEKALTSEDGFALAAGCCLYLGTGMILGVPIHMVLERVSKDRPFQFRFLLASLLGLAIWGLNFYAILRFVQPWLIGGDWIVTRIPIPVAVLTHLLFAWTVLAVHRWGQFIPHPKPVHRS